MNNDLISREALKNEFEKVYPLASNGFGGIVNKPIYDIIDNAPTVEGEIEILTKEAYSDLCLRASRERPTSEWIKEEDKVHSKCSLCGFKYADYGVLFDYCPNCGADMRGDRE